MQHLRRLRPVTPASAQPPPRRRVARLPSLSTLVVAAAPVSAEPLGGAHLLTLSPPPRLRLSRRVVRTRRHRASTNARFRFASLGLHHDFEIGRWLVTARPGPAEL